MKHTQPYAAIVPQPSDGAEVPLTGGERFAVELEGSLVLQSGAEPLVLRILDDHPTLAGAVRVGFDGVELRRPRVEVDDAGWARLRRGLTLCASVAVSGQLVARRPGAWRLVVEACGEPPSPPRRKTARFVSPLFRAARRPRFGG